jgi:hypothetical protein
MSRAFVMFNAETSQCWTSFIPHVDNDSTFVVASFSSLDSAVEMVLAVRSGELDLSHKPGPWIPYWARAGINPSPMLFDESSSKN